MKKGALITIYGVNNVGKTTQSKLLIEKIKECSFSKVKYLKYPVYDITPTGPMINKVLRGKDGQKISEDELQLWFILNRYQFQPELKKLLDNGYIVVAEDYIGTGIAWGMAKGLDEKWLINANKYLIKEDLSLYIQGKRDPHVKEAVHVHEQNDELVEKCKKTHEYLCEKYKWEKIIQGDINTTAKLIFNVVDDFLKQRYS